MICPDCDGAGSLRESWYENRHRCARCSGSGKLSTAQTTEHVERVRERIRLLRKEADQLEATLEGADE